MLKNRTLEVTYQIQLIYQLGREIGTERFNKYASRKKAYIIINRTTPLFSADKSYLEGQFNNGILHGQEKESFPDGRVCKGHFLNCMLHDQGMQTFPDGSAYFGE